MKVYVKSLFEVKKIPEATHGAHDLHGMIKEKDLSCQKILNQTFMKLFKGIPISLTLKNFC